jgi:FkbM family methyltransferase
MGQILRKVVRALRRMLPPPEQSTTRMLGGYRLKLYPRTDPLERRLYQDRTYEAGTLHLFDCILRCDDTVIDVGANLGLMTLHAAKRVGPKGTVIAIEPHPVYFQRLKENIVLNGLMNIKAVQVAAGSITERRPIHDVPSVNIGRSSLVKPDGESKVAGVVAVEPLDSIAERAQVSSVRLVKIDVEGFEPQVLSGASKLIRMQPIICMEVSDAVPQEGYPALAAHDLLISSGYYSSFLFHSGKRHPSPLIEARDRQRLLQQAHENVVYVPNALKLSLPSELFSN